MRVIRAPKTGTTYEVRITFTNGRIEHHTQPTLKHARVAARASLSNPNVAHCTILQPVEYFRKD